MENNKEQDRQKLKGNALTQEQFSDVYTAGTSDGVQQLANEKIQIKNESYDAGQKK